jgi:hypothetical protein
MKSLVEDDQETRMALRKVRAIPITATYELTVVLNTEIDVFKCSQALLNSLWLYKPIFFEYEYLLINAMLNMPDNKSITISREKNLKSDNTIKLTANIEVQTYYPAFLTDETLSVRPYRTRWYNISWRSVRVLSEEGILMPVHYHKINSGKKGFFITDI